MPHDDSPPSDTLKTKAFTDAIVAAFEREPMASRIEVDRFCRKCDYNMLGAAARKMPGIDLLLARCPECGTFESATDAALLGRVWRRRLAALLVSLWTTALIVFHFIVGVILFAILTDGYHAMRYGYGDIWARLVGASLSVAALTMCIAILDRLFLPHRKTLAQIGFHIGWISIPFVLIFALVWMEGVYDQVVAARMNLFVALMYAVAIASASTGAVLGRWIVPMLVRTLIPSQFRRLLTTHWLDFDVSASQPPRHSREPFHAGDADESSALKPATSSASRDGTST